MKQFTSAAISLRAFSTFLMLIFLQAMALHKMVVAVAVVEEVNQAAAALKV
jgi:hypothetical protein